MILACQHVDVTSEEDLGIFQAHFDSTSESEDSPYVLIQRGFLEEDDYEDSRYCYIETHAEELTGHYNSLEVVFTRSQLLIEIPPPINERIQIDFIISDDDFRDLDRILRIIFQGYLQNET